MIDVSDEQRIFMEIWKRRFLELGHPYQADVLCFPWGREATELAGRVAEEAYPRVRELELLAA